MNSTPQHCNHYKFTALSQLAQHLAFELAHNKSSMQPVLYLDAHLTERVRDVIYFEDDERPLSEIDRFVREAYKCQ